MDLSSVILLVGAVHGIFLSMVLLFLRSTKQLANKLLSLILFIFSIIILLHLGIHTSNLDQISKISMHFVSDSVGNGLFIFYFLVLLIGPLTYFYFLSLVDPTFALGKRWWIHFSPSILCLGMVIPYYFILNGVENQAHQFIENLVRWLVLFHFLLYIFLLVVVAYDKTYKTKFSKVSRSVIQLMTVLIIMYMTVWFVSILLTIMDAGYFTWNYAWIIASVLIYTCGYMGLKRPIIFRGSSEFVSPTGERYKKSPLTPELKNQYLLKIENILMTERPYLKSDISLPSLAGQLKIPVHHLSQILNEEHKQNFFEFINQHRIQHARELMLDDNYKHLKIAEICYLSGFNSLSVFNAAFKKIYNQTPSQFREQR